MHDRLGHPSDEYLKVLVKHDMLLGLRDLGPFPTHGVKGNCEACPIGEMHSNFVARKSNRVDHGGQNADLFMDIGGPWPVQSSKGYRYWNLIRERHGRHMAIYFMKTKDQVLDTVKQYLVDMKQTAIDLGCVCYNVELIMTDDDSLYVSKAFNSFTRDNNIQQFVGAPYTHALVGAVEGMMKYLQQGMIKLRHASGLPGFLWDELMSAFVVQCNRQYTRTCNEHKHKYLVPHSRQFPGSVPNVGRMVKVGAKTYVFKTKEQRSKGDDHAWIGYAVGYCYRMNAYRVYDPRRIHVYDCYHVLFDEHVVYKDEYGPSKQEQKRLQQQATQLRERELKACMNMAPSKLTEFATNVLLADVLLPSSEQVATVPLGEVRHGNDRSSSAADGAQQELATGSVNITPQRGVAVQSQVTEFTAQRSSKRKKTAKKIFDLGDLNTPASKWKQFSSACITMYNYELLNTPEECTMLNMEAMANVDVTTYLEPTNIQEALLRGDGEGELWRAAADEEVEWLVNKGIVVPVNRNDYKGCNVLNSGWAFKMKCENGKPTRMRPRFVPKGCGQIDYVDVNPSQVTSPVARKASIMMLMSIAVNMNLHTRVIDISKAFFSGKLDEGEIVLSKLPPGPYRTDEKYATHGVDTLWLYKYAAYGLRQASNRFNARYSEHLVANGYTQLKTCVCTFVRRDGDKLFVMCLWVDDNIIAYSHDCMLEHFTATLEGTFEFRDEGEWSTILGMDVDHDRERGVLTLSHESYLRRMFGVLNLDKLPVRNVPLKPGTRWSRRDCPVTPDHERCTLYRKLLGSIGHCARWVHPECSLAVSVASQFQSNPSQSQYEMLLEVAGYLKGQISQVITMKRKLQHGCNRLSLIGFSDSDYAADVDTRRSRSGSAWYLCGNLISAQSKLQQSVTLSTAEAEFCALTLNTTFAMWAMQWVAETGFELEKPVMLYSDSKSGLAIAQNANMNFKYSKHIDVRQMFIREVLKSGVLEVAFIRGLRNIPSDGMTKPYGKLKFRDVRDSLNGTIEVAMLPESEHDSILRNMHED